MSKSSSSSSSSSSSRSHKGGKGHKKGGHPHGGPPGQRPPPKKTSPPPASAQSASTAGKKSGGGGGGGGGKARAAGGKVKSGAMAQANMQMTWNGCGNICRSLCVLLSLIAGVFLAVAAIIELIMRFNSTHIAYAVLCVGFVVLLFFMLCNACGGFVSKFGWMQLAGGQLFTLFFLTMLPFPIGGWNSSYVINWAAVFGLVVCVYILIIFILDCCGVLNC